MASLIQCLVKLKRVLVSGTWHDRRESDENLPNPLANSAVMSRLVNARLKSD